MAFNLGKFFKKVEDKVEDALEDDDVKKAINAAEAILRSAKKSNTREPVQPVYAEPPARKYKSVGVYFQDGTRANIDVILNGYGQPDLSTLPEGARVMNPPRLMQGSSLSSTDRVGHLLPDRLAKSQPIYDAVGRIGYRQLGQPTGQERIYGTGILISPSHVLTNHHVAMFLNYEDDPENLGIEFGAEKGSDFSNFVRLKDISTIKIDGYDAAILTLDTPVTDRQPVSVSANPPDTLKNQNVLVIGYPTTFAPERPSLILGTKRYSEGTIFAHSKDKDDEVTVPVYAHPCVGKRVVMDVCCHSASTLPGSSGSAVVLADTGELIGLHFGSDIAYKYGEIANFAIPSEKIATAVETALAQHS